MKAYLQFGSWGGPYQTVSAEAVKDAPLWYHDLGLAQTASGYGSRLVQPWKLKFRGKWRRVYCVCWSNSGTNYCVVDGERVVVTLEH